MPSYDRLTWVIDNAPGKIMDFLNIMEKLDETRKNILSTLEITSNDDNTCPLSVGNSQVGSFYFGLD